jgi:chromosome partitioning protein
MHIITFCNSKGGVAKSTTSVNVAAALARKKFKTLIVDLDSQGSSTLYLGVELGTKYKKLTKRLSSVADSFYEGKDISECIVNVKPYLDICRGSSELALVEMKLAKDSEWFLVVSNILSSLPKYDYVIIDTPPALSAITINALIASDSLVIVTPPSSLDVNSVYNLLQEITEVRGLAPTGLVVGILLTRTRKLKTMTAHTEHLRKEFKELLFDVEIKESVYLPESCANAKDILTYKPRSAPALQYKNFTNELLFRIMK